MAQNSRKSGFSIRREKRSDGVPCWVVDLGIIDGSRRRKKFKTKTEAETFSHQKWIEKENYGTAALEISDQLRIEAKTSEKKLNEVGSSLSEAVNYFLKHARPVGGKKPLAQLIEEFLKSRTESGCRAEYLRVQGHVMGKVSRQFGGRFIHEISHTEIQEWMRSQKWSARTRKNYHSDLRNLFNFAIKQGYCLLNPLERIDPPKLDEAAPGILNPDQVQKLLEAASSYRSGQYLAYVAIGLFAGLRSSEIQALDWSEIDLEQKLIHVKGWKAKTRRRRVVGIADNLLLWLRQIPERISRVVPHTPNMSKHLSALAQKAEIANYPKNALRHSFGSYFLALHRDENRTALEMGNSPQKIFSNYREVVTPKEAKDYWEIKPLPAPENVLEFPSKPILPESKSRAKLNG